MKLYRSTALVWHLSRSHLCLLWFKGNLLLHSAGLRAGGKDMCGSPQCVSTAAWIHLPEQGLADTELFIQRRGGTYNRRGECVKGHSFSQKTHLSLFLSFNFWVSSPFKLRCGAWVEQAGGRTYTKMSVLIPKRSWISLTSLAAASTCMTPYCDIYVLTYSPCGRFQWNVLDWKQLRGSWKHCAHMSATGRLFIFCVDWMLKWRGRVPLSTSLFLELNPLLQASRPIFCHLTLDIM